MLFRKEKLLLEVIEIFKQIQNTSSLNDKKAIVTANKELLARHGAELFDLARENNIVILYEAAVAGGIPIILPIKTSLKANSFSSVAGILNGTTNYILTKMEEENRHGKVAGWRKAVNNVLSKK